MCDIDKIEGIDVNYYYKIGVKYEGKDGDKCNVKNMIDKVHHEFKDSLNKDLFKPTFNDIIVIYAKKPKPKFKVIWKDGAKDDLEGCAYTFFRKRKILLTYPLVKDLSSERALVHELGHWFFDRLFDDIIPADITRDGFDYKKYQEACAFYIEEKITKREIDCESFKHYTLDFHKDGCELLKKLKQNTNNIIKKLFKDYRDMWKNDL